MTMRLARWTGIVLVLTLSLAACSSGDDDGGGDDGGGGRASTEEFCDTVEQLAEDGEPPTDLEGQAEQLEELREVAPEEIQDDLDVIEEATQGLEEASDSSDVFGEAFDTALDPDFLEAASNVTSFMFDECDLDFLDDLSTGDFASDLSDLSDFGGAFSDLSEFDDVFSELDDISEFDDLSDLDDFTDFPDLSDDFSNRRDP